MWKLASLLAVALMMAGCLQNLTDSGDSSWRTDRELRDWVRNQDDYLQAIHWPGLDVEIRIHHKEGYAPSERTRTALLEEFGAAVPQKTIHLTDAPIPGDVDSSRRWSLGELRDNAAAWSAEPWPEGRAVMHLGFMDGCVAYSDDRPCIAGVSMGEVAYVMLDQMRMFSESNPQFRPSPLVPSQDERWLAVHELGHSFGLVDSGIQPVVERSSDDCRCHSDRSDSVMSGTGAAGSMRVPLGDGAEAILEGAVADRLEVYYFSAEDLEDFHTFQERGAEAHEKGYWDPAAYHRTRA